MTTAAITGSASGIGAAIRSRLEADGQRVIGIDLRGAEIEADLAEPAGRARAVAEIRARCGGRLDRLVLCAGLGPHVTPLGPIASVNYFGAVELLDGLLECLARGSEPAALAICSNSAQMVPFGDTPYVQALRAGDEEKARRLLEEGGNGVLAYAGSKLALGQAIRARAGRFGRAGVRLNALAPGTTRTAMLQATREHPVYSKGLEALDIPLGRWADPREIAATAAFLLGPEASYVHGSILFVDGGNDAAVRPDRF
jgi:NAD(P)-dependent dehydrogenase (short-subunit alcohol dehydrogenase family)